MGMMFEKIFKDLYKTSEKVNLIDKSISFMSSNNKDSENSLIFDFIFDDNGEYHYTGSQHGFGKIVTIFGRITAPVDGTYSVQIKSSDGGGGQWDNIKANQEVSCVINTSFWHETTITVYIQSNKPNINGHAVIDYSI